MVNGVEKPKYLLKESLELVEKGMGVRALLKLRCGNLEETNKYWLNDVDKVCVFCRGGKDNIKHYVL